MSHLPEETIITFFNAIRNDETKLVRFMVANEPTLIHETRGFKRRTPIHTCVSVNMLKIIVGLGATVNGTSSQWTTPFARILRHNPSVAIEMIRTLVDLGADVNQIDILGRNAFFYVPYGMIDILKEIGTDINLQDVSGETPLHHFCSSLVSVISIGKLMENGADPRIKSNLGETPLELLAKNERFYPGDKAMFYETLCNVSMKSAELDEKERKEEIWNKKREFALVVFSYGDRDRRDKLSMEWNSGELCVVKSILEDGVCGNGYNLVDSGKPWGRLIMEYI